MPRPGSRRLALAAIAGLSLAMAAASLVGAQSDLDDFMRQVMDRRDDNWKKLQQYILEEREELDIRGPGRLPLWGQRAEYTWFIRDGFFVRSPLRINGAAVGEEDRRKFEDNYLRRAKERDQRQQERDSERAAGANDSPAAETIPANIEGFIQQTRQPEFISSAYFLRFKFDSGRYAFVGREKLDAHDVLRVEYYPTKLFADDPDRERARERRNRDQKPSDKRVDDTVNRLLNKGSRVTLWIEPTAHQILKYTFDNVDADFFPAQWLASVTGLHATMVMSQPFPDIWLPRETDVQIGLMSAVGEVDMRYTLNYHDYRRAEITTGVRVPGARQP